MKIRALTALTCAAALCACNSNSGSNGSGANGGSANSAAAGGPSTTATGASPAPATGGAAGAADGQIEQQVNMTAQMIQSQVPIKQGPTTITSARANGAELVTAMTLPVPLNEQAVSAMQQQLPTQQCANPQLAQLIERGARFTYEITDSANKVSRITIDRCPDGAGAGAAPTM